MDQVLLQWKDNGKTHAYGPFDHKVFYIDFGDPDTTSDRTLLIIHGFPESSFSFHKVIDALSYRFDRMILLDLLGYGFSDKPTENYTYSLFEQADVAYSIWQHVGVKGGHLLAHDMGDSVATEILARMENGLKPSWFEDGLKSITFTNGSMVLGLAKLRITQKILLSRYGSLLKRLPTYKLFSQQVKSAHGNKNLTEEDVSHLWDLNVLKEGHHKTYLTIKYLNDRKRFENTRWLPALSKTKIPIHICWGNEDAVAKVEMAHYLKNNICNNAELTIMNGLGHFCQLGSPKKWSEYILAYYDKV